MSEQPAALRLADLLTADAYWNPMLGEHAAAELRRLHEVNQKLQQQLGEAVWNYGEKVRANQELLEALKQFASCELNEENCASLEVATRRIRSVARAAIAKGEQA